jgi:hypothetical protein
MAQRFGEDKLAAAACSEGSVNTDSGARRPADPEQCLSIGNPTRIETSRADALDRFSTR